MSVPGSVLQAQRIASAQTAARAALERLREAEARRAGRMMESLADRITELLLQHADAAGNIRPESLYLLEPLLRQLIDDVLAEWRQSLSIALAAGIAQGAAGAALGGSAAVTSVISRATAFLDAYRAADGLTLSDRLWRVSTRMQDDMLSLLRVSVTQGSDAARLVEQLLAAGQHVPPALASQVRTGTFAALAGRLRAALTGEGGSARHVLERVVRTETNRAYTETFIIGLGDTPGVAGVKFRLSPLHPRPDICDLYAAANLHGLGPGVYPLGAHPYPAHPNTLSYLVPVFVEEVTEEDRAGQQTAFDWLRYRSADDQNAILGGQKKGDAFRAGRLLPDELRWPWWAIAQRLGDD